MGSHSGKVRKKKSKQQKKPLKRSEETLANTTSHKLRQCRSNPHANVRLSGKKKRKLIKEARRLVNEGLAMEVNDVTSSTTTTIAKEIKQPQQQKMEIS